LWYGFIYYSIFIFLTFIATLLIFRIFYLNLFYKTDLVIILMRYVLSFFTFFSLVALLVLYYILDFFSNFNIGYSSNQFNVFFFDYYCYDFLISSNSLNLNLVSVYYFPFIYIFVIITTLSILFCLAYNINEVMVFIFYCTTILMAGYLLFFTDSIILFFLAYELLLVPSFFYSL